MDIRVISSYVGKALLVSALFMVIAALISVFDGIDSAFSPLVISAFITILVGGFPLIFVRKTPEVSLKEGFLIIVLSWLLSFLFGMLPYVLWGGEFTLVNAWFESVSGYTTTGASILNDVEALPRSLLFWRSSTHFIGGLGVVVFLLLVLPSASPYRLRLTNIELSTLSKEGYRYKSSKTVLIITSVYLGITILCALSFWLAGMTFFDAINHAFSVGATGGFSINNLSLMHYDSNLIDGIAMLFMTLSAMHFGSIFAVLATRSLKPLNNPIFKYYLSSIVVFSVLVACSLKFDGHVVTWGEAFMNGSFNVISYMTTTGLANSATSQWPIMASILLMYVSFQCGCSGSTAGGVKVDRLVIAFKAFASEIRHRIFPSSVSPVRIGKHLLPETAVKSVFIYLFLYIIVLLSSFLLLTISGVDALEALSGTIASLGNVGMGVSNLGAFGSFSSQTAFAKIIYSLDMFFGRLEIFPILVVVSLLLKRGK